MYIAFQQCNMSIDFPHFYTSVNWTLGYYTLYRIESEFQLLNGKGYGFSNSKIIYDSYDLAFELHNRMESEIIQTIETCYPSRQILLFETLKDWQNDFRITKTNAVEVYWKIHAN